MRYTTEISGLAKERNKEIRKIVRQIREESDHQDKLILEGLKKMSREELKALREFLKDDSGVEQEILLDFIGEVLRGKCKTEK